MEILMTSLTETECGKFLCQSWYLLGMTFFCTSTSDHPTFFN